MAGRPAVRSVYLDVCALSRLFDDQVQARIRLETEAVKLILGHARAGSFQLIVSQAHHVEIEAINDLEERKSLERILTEVGSRSQFDFLAARFQAEEFVRGRIGVADAVHLAFAEQAAADFVSVDDRLLKRAARLHLPIWIGSPVQFCEKENLR